MPLRKHIALATLRDQPHLLPEFREFYELIGYLGNAARVRIIDEVVYDDIRFPLVALCLGPTDKTVPTLGLFAGVHGLERIGTRVLLAFLRTLVHLFQWDNHTKEMLNTTRLVIMPIINPIGMYLNRRSNGNGVDLMRTSPSQSDRINSPLEIYAGHRISPLLPWYQGRLNAPMEIEAKAVCEFVKEEIFQSSVSISVDIHSGYGTRDRFWFPYAKTKIPFSRLAEAFALKRLLDKTYPNHIYKMEPQSKEYTTHGDLWDYLYDEHLKLHSENIFIPFCLEMGSWLWVKKNLRQVFSLMGVFNPIAQHRLQRTLRRHVNLFDFLVRAVGAGEAWARLSEFEKKRLNKVALEVWYGE
jgi:hypothetical protein